MFNSFLNYLAISVSEADPIYNGADEKMKTVWIVALIAVIAICIALSRVKLDIGDRLEKKKIEREQKRREENRNAELERLHEIKRKNKRR